MRQINRIDIHIRLTPKAGGGWKTDLRHLTAEVTDPDAAKPISEGPFRGFPIPYTLDPDKTLKATGVEIIAAVKSEAEIPS